MTAPSHLLQPSRYLSENNVSDVRVSSLSLAPAYPLPFDEPAPTLVARHIISGRSDVFLPCRKRAELAASAKVWLAGGGNERGPER